MSKKVAIIGLGIMGRRMLDYMNKHDGYEPVALWDPSRASCEEAQRMAANVPVVADAEAAITSADLVYLACPPVPRRTYALAAADAGKAVFLEKPLGVSVVDSEDLVSRLEASGVPAAVNFTQAAGPAMTRVVQSARAGDLGDVVGADILITYAAWPREWQKAADWLRFKAEGGMTREVVSHFLFFSERVLGPLSVVHARPTYPKDPALCETHLLARLESASGQPVSILASVGGAQPDRQELVIKGTKSSRRISNFYVDATSDGGAFVDVAEPADDPRSATLQAQLDDLLLCLSGQSNRLATPREALRVQKLVEEMLIGKG